MRYLTGLPNILDSKKLSRKLEDVLESGVLTNSGPQVQKLEEKMEQLLKVPCVAFSNATVGLEALCRILKFEDYWVPSFTFMATASAPVLAGKSIRFLDLYKSSDPGYTYLPSLCEKTNGSGILIANLFGSCIPYDSILHRNKEQQIIYDNAHALGVKFNGESLATKGLASVYSLHATKFINGIEGGIVACVNPLLVEKLKQYRNFGFSTGPGNRFTGDIESIGSNAKMSELHACTALHNLHYLEFLIDLNMERHSWYKKYLPEQCQLIDYPAYCQSNYSYIVIRVPAFHRDPLSEFLYKEGIYVKHYFKPLHKLPVFNSNQDLINTEEIAKEVIVLPQGIQLKSEKDVILICDKIKQFFKKIN